MKTQFISLLLVASVALARPVRVSDDTASASASNMARRTLIGDEYDISNQVDNSRGKKIFRVDHNGDSSVHKCLLYDLVEPARNDDDNGGEDDDFQFKRRSLLGDLLGGGDSMTISNENDNSKHTQTMNEHGNRHTTITKIHNEQQLSQDDDEDEDEDFDSFFDKRASSPSAAPASALLDRRGLLFGGDSTSISNYNDNSQHRQTVNIHNSRDTTINKVLHKQSGGARHPRRRHGLRRGDAIISKGFYDRRDDDNNSITEESTPTPSHSSENAMERRSLLDDLLGGSSTSISNTNDNSQTKKILTSHGNRNTHITKKIHKSRHGHGFDKRGLLFGGDSMVISNTNDNSQTKKTFNSHGNRNTYITKKIHKSRHGFDKRGLLFGGSRTSISNINDNSQNKQILNSHNNVDKTIIEKNMRVVEDGF
ncbi:hypothetical protein BGX23_007391 [Mortierella sp. AD031]|nr:hypothetical protein BGX23_007391 [Mortierella sp. AD031]KAG0208946.1 hypothetical protein BGX33_005915 [Mortierella sp. NVP41]